VLLQRTSYTLDVLVVRKIGAPDNPELAIGATNEEGILVLNEQIIKLLKISPKEFEDLVLKKNLKA